MNITDFLSSLQRKHQAAFSIAIALAKNNQGVGGRKRNSYKLGAVLVNKRGHVLTIGKNSYKTHPKTKKYSIYPYLHAEQEAIFRYGYEQEYDNISLYIARVLKAGHIGTARPCSACQQLLVNVGIHRVFYTDSNTHSGWSSINPN